MLSRITASLPDAAGSPLRFVDPLVMKLRLCLDGLEGTEGRDLVPSMYVFVGISITENPQISDPWSKSSCPLFLASEELERKANAPYDIRKGKGFGNLA